MVERGDSLWEIANAYGMTVRDLKELNGLTGDQIYPGQELQLGGNPPMILDAYTVKQGDYLSKDCTPAPDECFGTETIE